MARWPDVQVAVMDLLADLGETGTETPTDLQQQLVFIRVRRFGGPDDGVTDFPLVDVDVFGATYEAAEDAAETVRERLVDGYHQVDSALLDRVETVTGPRELPWAAQGVRRWGATYRVHTRRTITV